MLGIRFCRLLGTTGSPQARPKQPLCGKPKDILQARQQKSMGAQRWTPTISAGDRADIQQARQANGQPCLPASLIEIAQTKHHATTPASLRAENPQSQVQQSPEACAQENLQAKAQHPNIPCKLKRKTFRGEEPDTSNKLQRRKIQDRPGNLCKPALTGHGRSQSETCVHQGLCASWTPTILPEMPTVPASSQMIETLQATAQSPAD